MPLLEAKAAVAPSQQDFEALDILAQQHSMPDGYSAKLALLEYAQSGDMRARCEDSPYDHKPNAAPHEANKCFLEAVQFRKRQSTNTDETKSITSKFPSFQN
eukprot:827650-Amphidinium_carterae.1